MDDSEGAGFIAARGKKRDYKELIKNIESALAENLKNTGEEYITKDRLVEIAGLNRNAQPDTLTRNIERIIQKVSELDITPKKFLYYNREADVFSFSKESTLSAKVINRRKPRTFKNKKERGLLKLQSVLVLLD